MSVFKGSYIANGNIAPSRLVKLDSSADGKVLQCGAGDKCVGVSQEGTRYAPYTPLDDGYAAIAGEEIEVYLTGSECYLEAGGTVAPGDRLKADSSGRGVATTTNLDEYNVMCLQAGVLGTLVKVRVNVPAQVSA